MATSIISAGDAANLGVQTTGGDDGVLVLRSGAAGAKVDALSIAAVGTGAFVGEVTATGFTGTLDGVLGGGTPAAATVTTFTSNGIDDNADALAITINSSENVGIGTAAPASKLHLHSSGDTGLLITNTTTGSDADSGLEIKVISSGGEAYIRQQDNAGLRLGTNDIDRLTINSIGNVGIGTTAPATKLDVNGGFAVSGSVSGFGGGEVRLGTNSANLDNAVSTISTGTASMFFDHRGTSTGKWVWRCSSSERMTLDASGNLGIGTSTPAAKLSVVGDVTVTGDLSANNFAGRNRIINPSGIINQRGAQTALGTENFVDRWQTHTGNTTAVVNGNSVSGYIELDFTTADTSLAASEYIFLAQKIEGFNSASLLIGTASAKTITISFKHKHTKTGVNSVALRNSANNRFYVFNYTQSVSNTEETHSETITLDTTGTWIGATNGIGLEILFTVLTGPNQSTATAGSWAGSGTLATSTQVNNGDSASNFFRITDVQFEEGTVATEFEYKPYGTELALCHRYFQLCSFVGNGATTGEMGIAYAPRVIMRTGASMSTVLRSTDNYTGTDNQITHVGFGGVTVGSSSFNISSSGNAVRNILCTGLVAGGVYAGSFQLNAEL